MPTEDMRKGAALPNDKQDDPQGVTGTSRSVDFQVDCIEPEAPSVSLRALQAWASIGLQLFPCHSIVSRWRCSCGKADCSSPGKHPRTSNGVKAATGNVEQLKTWLAMWPD